MRAKPLRGGITDLESLRSGVQQAEGVIHLAFGHDFSSTDAITRAVDEEAAALNVIGAELVGSDRPFVTVSGTPWIPGSVSTEADRPVIEGPFGGRFLSVAAVLELASRGVRSSAVRMPRTVHNQGRGGFAGLLTDIARSSGVSGYAGDGHQRWPAVHALDAAVLFRLALESAPGGTVWQGGCRRRARRAQRRPSLTRATKWPTLRPSSAEDWDCRSRAFRKSISAPWGRSSRWINRHPVRTRETRSAGSHAKSACSWIWRTCSRDREPVERVLRYGTRGHSPDLSPLDAK